MRMARRLHAPRLRCCVQPVIANSARPPKRATSVRCSTSPTSGSSTP